MAPYKFSENRNKQVMHYTQYIVAQIVYVGGCTKITYKLWQCVLW